MFRSAGIMPPLAACLTNGKRPKGAASREEFCRVGIIPAERNI